MCLATAAQLILFCLLLFVCLFVYFCLFVCFFLLFLLGLGHGGLLLRHEGSNLGLGIIQLGLDLFQDRIDGGLVVQVDLKMQ